MGDDRIDQIKGDLKEAEGKVTGDAAKEAEGAIESTVAGVRREAGEAVDKAADVAGDVAGKATDMASDVVDKAGDVAGDVADKARDVLDR